MNNNVLNKPNKKLEIRGSVMLIIGIAMILLRVFVIKNIAILIIGIVLVLFGFIAIVTGKYGAEKTLEMGFAYEKEKAKTIAKGIKEGLKDKEK